MLTLVTGGSASGKSEFAEQLLLTSKARNRVYLATMDPCDRECQARILRHRAARAGRGFLTIERAVGLSGTVLPEDSAVLLECLSNLAANELFSKAGAHEWAFEEITGGLDVICGQAKEIVVVSGEVFSDGEPYDPETLRYLELLGRLNAAIAQRADRVVEVVCSIPVYHKGAKL